jgi:hypothetical protein
MRRWPFTNLKWVLVLLVGVMVHGPVAPAEAVPEADGLLGITGLLLDETRSPVGREFYDRFAASWDPSLGLTATVVITELADPRFGSQITVRIQDTVVYRRFLSPRLSAVEEGPVKLTV